MKKVLMMFVAVMVLEVGAYAAYVRISTLNDRWLLKPPNPVTISGMITSEVPVTINDGSGELNLYGITPAKGDYLIVTGDWGHPFIIKSTKCYIGSGPMEVYIPAGDFLMGNSGVGDDALYSRWSCDEFSQHSVNLPAYYIGKYDVTRGEYRNFINARGYSNPIYWSSAGWKWIQDCYRTQPNSWDGIQTWGNASFTQTDHYPVVGVSYYEAEAYCNWAGVRLPTEAEWEKAARWDGHPRIYPWGDTYDPEKCNNYYDHNPAGGGYGASQTSPVGSYPSGASPYGCMDMAGNVWQWCSDWYKSYPGGGCLEDYTGSQRVKRGWCWNGCAGDYGRCAARDGVFQFSSDYTTGFRIARSAP